MPFRLIVEDVFSITGRGTIITGTVEGAPVSVGDELLLTRSARGAQVTFRLSGIEKRRRNVETAEVGDAVGLLVPIEREQASRGDVIERVDDVAEPLVDLAQIKLNEDAQDAPLLLLPARIETRFNREALRIRVFPDALHSCAPPRALSSADIVAGESYLNNRAREGEATARALLNTLLGSARAAFVARRALKGTLVEETPHDGRLIASFLPERFIFHVVEETSQSSFAIEGEDVDPDLALLPGAGDRGFALSSSDPAFWLRDFETARAKGMATEVPLPVGLADVPESRFTVSVFGVRGGNGLEGAATTKELFERLADTRELEQVTPGTATKGDCSGKNGAFVNLENGQEAGDELGRALGLDDGLPEPARAAPESFRLSQALFTVLWEACLRPMAVQTLGREVQSHGLTEGDIDLLGRDLAANLRPFCMPHLKAGNELLAVLPVRWQDDRATANEMVRGVSKFARSISGTLARTAEDLRASNSVKPGASRLVNTLMRAPIGQGWRRRMRWFAPELASAFVRIAETGTQGTATVDAVRRTLSRNESKLRKVGLDTTLGEARSPLPQFIGSPFADLLCGPLVARDALSKTDGPLDDAHIAALIETGGTLRDGQPTDSADNNEAALPILSTLLEDAMLLLLSDISALGEAGGDTDRAARLLAAQEREPFTPRPRLAARLLEQFATPGDLTSERRVLASAADRAAHLSQLLSAMKLVQSQPPAAVHLTLAALIDCFATRFDAWTDLDVRRTLSAQRNSGRTGTQLGTWAFVEGLRRSSDDKAEYVFAPSPRLARLAGLMLRANEAITALGMDGAATAALDSTRVANARKVIVPLARGEDFEDVLARLVLERVPANRRIAIARLLSASMPRSEDEEGENTPLQFSPLRLIETGAGAVRGLDPDDRFALEAGLELAGAALEAVADIALAEGALNLAEARPEAAQSALAQRSAGAIPQADPRAIAPLPGGSSLSFITVLTGRSAGNSEDLRGGLAPTLADMASRLIGEITGTVTFKKIGDGEPLEEPQRELASLGFSPLGLAWLAADDVPTELMLGTIAAMRAGLNEGWIVETDDDARATLWAAGRAHAAISSARSLTGQDFEGELGLENAAPLLDEVLLQSRIANARNLLSNLKDRAGQAIDALADADGETALAQAASKAGSVIADCLAAGIVTGSAGMEWPGLLTDAIAAVDMRIADASSAPDNVQTLTMLLGDMPACLPLTVPQRAPWMPRRNELSGASKDEIFDWMEISQRVRERLEPCADLLLARPKDIICQTLQWPPPGDQDEIDWIGGARRHNEAYHSRASLVAFGGWEIGDTILEALVIDAWQETVPDPKQTAALALRAPAPPARAPKVMLLAPAPVDTSWTAKDVQAVIDQAIANAKMRALDLTDFPGRADARSEAGDLGAILPALATISPGSALARSLCATLPEGDR